MTTDQYWRPKPENGRIVTPIRVSCALGLFMPLAPAETSVALTGGGRKALGHYTTVLRELLDSASPN
jgi:hypothetical protein